jgi:hypothetical protein
MGVSETETVVITEIAVAGSTVGEAMAAATVEVAAATVEVGEEATSRDTTPNRLPKSDSPAR